MVNKKQEHKKGFTHSDDESIRLEFIDKFLGNLKVPVKTSHESIWNNIHDRIESKKSELKKTSFKVVYQLSAAASILIIIGLFLFSFYSNKSIQHITEPGRISEIILPDLSEVILNAGSRLEYKKNLWNGSREVFLEGEAIFNVKKGKKFVVKTSSGVVEVLGTSFNVHTRNKNLKVSCFTGKVSVKTNVDNMVYLTKGLETKLSDKNGLIKPYCFDMEKLLAWQKGEFHFENSDFLDVINELELQYNIKVKYTELNKRFYTGSFLNNNLKDALTLVCLPMSLSFKIEKNEVVIY